MCGGGCSDAKVDFTAERFDFDSNKTAELSINFAGCRGVMVRNIGTATLWIDSVIEVEPDSTKNICPPGGGTFARNKRMRFDTPNGETRIVEIVYFKEVEEDCPPIKVS
jgi:hypothetical protein